MICKNCGAEIDDNVKFCSNCGTKVTVDKEEQIINHETNNENAESQINIDSAEKKKDSVKSFWKELKLGDKILLISLAVFILMAVVAIIFGKAKSAALSIISIILVVLSLFMKKKVIKVKKDWVHTLLFILAIALVIPYCSQFPTDYGNAENIKWSDLHLGNKLPEPNDSFGDVNNDSDDNLVVDISKTDESDYKEYIDKCIEAGYTEDSEKTDNSYTAFNNDGYKLNVDYTQSLEEMRIDLDAPEKYSDFQWPSSKLANLLPKPKSTLGEIVQDDDKCFDIYVSKTSIDDYKSYITECENKGFNVDMKDKDKYFSAKNKDGNKLTVKYEGNNVISIVIQEPEYKVNVNVKCQKNAIFSQYDVEMYVNDDYEGEISHGESENFELELPKGTHTLKFVDDEDDSINGEIEITVSKNQDYKFKISCTGFGIDVETISGEIAEDDTTEAISATKEQTKEISVKMSADKFKGMTKKEAEKKFTDMGFENIENETVNTKKSSLNGKVKSVEIGDLFSVDDFSSGDKFDSDETVTIYTYKYTKPKKASPVFYSTNDYKNAKKGNKGVFSYVESTGSYEVYYIIDFNKGYVYYFTDGNGDETCDKLKIESGDLNHKVTTTYHVDGEEWSNYFHFKYENHPETLIMVDDNGFETKFTTVSLSDALSIRDSKKIIER